MRAQVDSDTGRESYLGTGIGNLKAAKSYLRAKFRQQALPTIVSRPGSRFYVTAQRGAQVAYLLGPYVSHMTALTAVPRAQQMLAEVYPADAPWVSVGTASLPETVPTRFGR